MQAWTLVCLIGVKTQTKLMDLPYTGDLVFLLWALFL